MPTRVQLPDGSVGEFPDGMSEQDIETVLQKQYGGPKAQQPGLLDRISTGLHSLTDNRDNEGFLMNMGRHALGDVLSPVTGAVDMARSSPGQQAVAGMNALGSALDFIAPGANSTVRAVENAKTGHPYANIAGDALALGGSMAAGEVVPRLMPAIARAAGRALLLGKTPEGAYESALKPSTTLSQADRASIVNTGLQNEIPVSKAGLEKIGDQIDALNHAIKDQIASDPNRPIDPNAVATRTSDTAARFSNQVNATPDLQAIKNSRDLFLQEQGATPGNPAPPMGAAQAQAMKQGTYSVLKGKFGEQGSAAVEAQKALARGLKEEIANQFPEISNLNAQESKLLDLEPVLERAVNRISNHQLIGIGTPVAGVAAKAVTGSGSVGVVATALKAVLDNPMVKSRLAISVSKGAKIPYAQAIARVGAYSSALGSIVAAPQGYSSDGNPSQPTIPQP